MNGISLSDCKSDVAFHTPRGDSVPMPLPEQLGMLRGVISETVAEAQLHGRATEHFRGWHVRAICERTHTGAVMRLAIDYAGSAWLESTWRTDVPNVDGEAQ
ncbi:hypothetical protein [Burkholderia cenocepacia]|uniref:hypothetical protein n=1 Tax=Burkholderia cenocepacia TaxID=95486 RepID=UPI00222EB94B|nr:hypothetical protein [Burkholderia cenocepacia]MCW3677823.1 hypothetical protein [Burkholderia cenocepacia]